MKELRQRATEASTKKKSSVAKESPMLCSFGIHSCPAQLWCCRCLVSRGQSTELEVQDDKKKNRTWCSARSSKIAFRVRSEDEELLEWNDLCKTQRMHLPCYGGESDHDSSTLDEVCTCLSRNDGTTCIILTCGQGQ